MLLEVNMMEMKTLIFFILLGVDDTFCKDNIVRFLDGYQFIAITSVSSYYGASQACSLMGGSLMDVKTDERHNLAMDLRRNTGKIDLWTSGNKLQSDVWKWGDDTRINTNDKHWVKWSGHNKEPNNVGWNACLAIYIHATSSVKGWVDFICDKQKGYICQRKANFTLDGTLKTVSQILPWLITDSQSTNRGTQECSQTNVLVRWSRKVIALNYNYKLYIEDLLTKSTKTTSVEIMYGIDPIIRISEVKSKSDVCSMTYNFYVSSELSISAEILTGRIVGNLLSVITKVQHKYPSKTFELVVFDPAGAT